MGQLIDCQTEFLIKKQVSHIKRAIAKTDHADQVTVILESDDTSSTGIGFKLFHNPSKRFLNLNVFDYMPSELLQVQNIHAN